MWLTAVSPCAFSAEPRLFDCRPLPENSPNTYALKRLPPSFDTVLATTPLVLASGVDPLVVIVISWVVPVLSENVWLYPPPVLFMLLNGIPFRSSGI
jgi:hypothetical protein